MRHWYAYIVSIVMLMIIASCGNNLTEEQLRAKARDYENKEQWKEMATTLETLINKYPDSKNIDESLYNLGFVYANNLNDFDKAIACYNRIIKEFPQSGHVINSQFMIGYTYANNLKDMEKARKAYTEFLQKHPDHELASSVQWELDNLGKDITDIELQLEEPETKKNN